MSWLTKLNDIKLSITTGDGKIYYPLWKNAIKNIEYNTEAFEFVGIPGTYVERKEHKSNQYPILLYFQGESCIDESEAFELSAQDKRAWVISHPFYGEITVQPLNLSIDNSDYNISRITGTVWETIDQKYPDDVINSQKEIDLKKSEIDIESQAVFVDNIETPSPEIIEPANNSILRTGRNYNVLIQTESDATLLKDRIRSASASVQEIISNTTRYISQANDLINFPFLIVQNINQKVDQMINTFNDFTSIFLGDDTDNEKQIMYESQSTMLLSELSHNLINTNINDYDKRSDVIDVISTLSDAYELFLKNLDDLGYVQDKELSKQLDYIINITLSSLYDVAFESKQERNVILDKDNNIIVLAHRYYGTGDDNLNKFIKQNNISLREYLGLQKGREITYFV